MSSINTERAIGYKRPPPETKFKPGQSGNRKGRPKGRPNMADAIRQSATEPVTVIVDGKKRTMSTAEAMIRKCWTDALKGEKHAISLVIGLLDMTGRTSDIGEEERNRRRITLPRSFTAEEYSLQSDYAPALEKDRQRYLATYDAEDDESPGQDTLRPPAIRNADRLAALKDYDAALGAYRRFIGEHRAVLAGDAENVESRDSVYLGACRIAVVAYARLLAGEFEEALNLVEEALTLAPRYHWIEMIRAHAWMFLGRTEDAQVFYRHFKSDRRFPVPAWESVILRDFGELRAGGHFHPLMLEIEAHIRELGWTAEGPNMASVSNLWQAEVDGHKVNAPSPIMPSTHSVPPSLEDVATGQPAPTLSNSEYIMYHPSELHSGDLHIVHGKLDEALGIYRINLEKLERLVAKNPNDTESKDRLHQVLNKMSELAFRFILAKRPPTAFECITDVIRREPNEPRHQLKLAHSYLCLSRQTEARVIYQQHQNEKLEDGTPWKSRLFQDFAEMRQAGVKYPLMDRMERELGLR